MCIYDGPYVSLSLQRFFYFPSAILYFPSAIFYFPSPFFKFPFRVSFLLPFTIYFISLQSFLLLLSTIFCTSLHHFFYSPLEFFYFTSAFLSAFYFPSAFLLPFRVFTTLFICLQCFLLPFKVLLFFYFLSAFFLLPSSFFKLFLLSFGIFIVSFLIFKYRRKLNCNNFLLDKKFLKSISKASLGHVKTILKPSLKINDWIIAGYLFRYLVCGLN